MRELVFSSDLCNPYVPHRKEWVQAVLAGVGLAASLIGGAQSAKAAAAAERRQRIQEAKDDAWYRRRYNEDYIDTAAGQNLVRRAKEYAKQSWKRAAGAQAVAGGTAASTQMAKDAGNKMVGDTISNIAATDVQRKDSVDAAHRASQQRYAQMDMQRDMQRAQNIASSSSAAGNALMSMGGALEQNTRSSVNLGGGSNKSIEFNPAPVEKPAPVYNHGESPLDAYNQSDDLAMKQKFRDTIFG